MTYKQLEKKN